MWRYACSSHVREHSHNQKNTRKHKSALSGCVEFSLLGGLYCSSRASRLGPSWCLGMFHACVLLLPRATGFFLPLVLGCCFLVSYIPHCWRRGLSLLVSAHGLPMCLGLLHRGVLNSLGVDSWCPWLFLCGVTNCCCLVAWMRLSCVLDWSLLTSWIAPSWCPGLLAAGRGRQSAAIQGRLYRCRQGAAGQRQISFGPLFHLQRFVALHPPDGDGFPVTQKKWLFSNVQRAASSLSSKGGRSPTAKGRTPHRIQTAATALPLHTLMEWCLGGVKCFFHFPFSPGFLIFLLVDVFDMFFFLCLLISVMFRALLSFCVSFFSQRRCRWACRLFMVFHPVFTHFDKVASSFQLFDRVRTF